MISDLEIYCLVNSNDRCSWSAILLSLTCFFHGKTPKDRMSRSEVIRKYSDSNTQIMLTREVDSFLARDSEDSEAFCCFLGLWILWMLEVSSNFWAAAICRFSSHFFRGFFHSKPSILRICSWFFYDLWMWCQDPRAPWDDGNVGVMLLRCLLVETGRSHVGMVLGWLDGFPSMGSCCLGTWIGKELGDSLEKGSSRFVVRFEEPLMLLARVKPVSCSPGMTQFIWGSEWTLSLIERVRRECLAEQKQDEDTLERLLYTEEYEARGAVSAIDLSKINSNSRSGADLPSSECTGWSVWRKMVAARAMFFLSSWQNQLRSSKHHVRQEILALLVLRMRTFRDFARNGVYIYIYIQQYHF